MEAVIAMDSYETPILTSYRCIPDDTPMRPMLYKRLRPKKLKMDIAESLVKALSISTSMKDLHVKVLQTKNPILMRKYWDLVDDIISEDELSNRMPFSHREALLLAECTILFCKTYLANAHAYSLHYQSYRNRKLLAPGAAQRSFLPLGYLLPLCKFPQTFHLYDSIVLTSTFNLTRLWLLANKF